MGTCCYLSPAILTTHCLLPGAPLKPLSLGWVYPTKPPATAIAAVLHGHHLRVAHPSPAGCTVHLAVGRVQLRSGVDPTRLAEWAS
jgi:hypothetical protein